MIVENDLKQLSFCGYGLGLRPKHYPYIFEHSPKVDWFEVISENFMDTDGRPKRNLARIAEQYPIVMHGVALSIGTIDPLNSEYLAKLKAMIDWVKPAWVSDHLCWTGIAHKNTHDLLPVPYTEEALNHITSRIRQVQDYLGRPIALENPSTYLEFKSSTMPEAEFIARMVEISGCNLLLDVNNVYVTCYNHRLDPKTYIDALPLNRVIQIHLSGHSNYGTHIIDTHDDHVIDDVWALYKYVLDKSGRIPNTMIEWDDNIPDFPVLYAELGKARKCSEEPKSHNLLPDLAKETEESASIDAQRLDHDLQLMQNAVIAGSAIDVEAETWIRSKENFAPVDQIGVYINAYRSRLYDVTAEDYPVLKHYLGDKVFDELMGRFVETVRSDHFNIGRYAAKLPKFLEQHISSNHFAYELSVLESALSQLCDPEETIALIPEHIKGLEADVLMEAVIHPRKALQLFQFNHHVNQYYCAVKEGKSLPESNPMKSYLVVFRHDDVVWRMNLEEPEWRMLSLLFRGVRVKEALETVQTEHSAEDLSRWFSRWIRNGLLAYLPDKTSLVKTVAT